MIDNDRHCYAKRYIATFTIMVVDGPFRGEIPTPYPLASPPFFCHVAIKLNVHIIYCCKCVFIVMHFK
jgi:hypothetical protein